MDYGAETTALQARIKRLEDQLKTFRFIFVIVCFALGSLVALQTHRRAILTAGIVRAHRFAVVDEVGKTVAELSRDNGPTRLVLYKPAAEFTLAGWEPSIAFYDAEQKQRAILGMLAGVPTLAMHDAGGDVRTLLTADRNESIFWLKEEVTSLVGFQFSGERR